MYLASMRRKNVVVLKDEDRQQLEKYIRSPTTPARLQMRAKVVLAAAERLDDSQIASRLRINRHTCRLWRQRYLAQGMEGLRKDAPGRGRKPLIGRRKVQRIVAQTMNEKPANATHWSVRTMAKAQNVSPATVQRIWHRYQLKPHLVHTFKMSKDPAFFEKLEDVVGLYLNPPEKALVFCFDEKSQIQALDRTRPILPLRQGIPERQTHDYTRHGTTTLFAALSVLDGTVIGQCHDKHRHQEFIKFLNLLDQQTPADKQLHLIVDNYATHKHPRVKAWLKRHKRFHFHFTPTASSWLNLIERWFRELTTKRIRRGAFASVNALIGVINEYIHHNNREPKAFIWTATVTDIMRKINKTKECIAN